MTAALEMSAPAKSQKTTPEKELNEALTVLKDKATERIAEDLFAHGVLLP